MTIAWGEKIFYECVASVCLTFGLIFLVIAFLFGIWALDGCDDYIICNTNGFTQISLELQKWLAYNDFILKDTKLLSKLP